MKQILFKFTLICLLFGTGVAYSQTLSTSDQVLDGSSFGNEILVPINSQDITSSYGNITVAGINIDYNDNILDYVEYINVNPGFPGDMTIEMLSPGTSSDIEISIEAGEFFVGFAWPDGKMFDLKFVFSGGDAEFQITSAEFLLTPSFESEVPAITQGSVVGYADITATNGAWSSTNTWTGDLGALTEPGIGHNVTINSGGTVTIDADAEANSVSIADGGWLTLDAATTLAVTGDFTVLSGGSFLQNGTLTAANTKAERAVPAANWADPNSGWHQVASPVANQAIDGDWTPSGAAGDYDFYAWSEPQDLWLNQKEGGITTFNVGQGYMVAYENGGTKTFAGTFNTADVDKSLTNQGAGELGNYDAGANLLGNPYPVALTWETSWIPAGVQGTAYIWSGSAYAAISDGDPIPAMNGFMVLTTVDDNDITIEADSRAHNAQAWHKTTSAGIKLIANDLEAGSQQETHINFNPEATAAYDLAYDAYYLSGFAPQLYTMADEAALMVNSMPAMQEDTKIPMHFEKTEAENFSIQLVENSLSVPVYLRDLKLNTTVKLSEMMEYHFSAEAGDSPERFEVFFSALGVDDLTEAQTGAFARDNSIVVYGFDSPTNVELYNLAGQLVFATQTAGTGQFEINTGLKQGMYIVKLSSQSATNSVKVFIR